MIFTGGNHFALPLFTRAFLVIKHQELWWMEGKDVVCLTNIYCGQYLPGCFLCWWSVCVCV